MRPLFCTILIILCSFSDSLLAQEPQQDATNPVAGHTLQDHNHPAEDDDAPLVPQAEMGLWVTEKTGDFIAGDATFTDSKGNRHTLRDLIKKPTLLLPIYYYCPKTCTFNLANLATAIQRSRHNPSEYQVIALSFNHEESPKDAALAKANYLQITGPYFPADNWHFLVGSKADIHKTTDSLGFRFKEQEDGTFIHPSTVIALAKDGKIIKYVYGSFVAGDVDMAINEAIKGTPAISVKRLLAFCFNYNPQKNLGVFSILKTGAVITMIVTGLFFLFFLTRKKKHDS
jgi:protein SCO1